MPLAEGDTDVAVELGAAVAHTYRAGDCSGIPPFDEPNVPSLRPENPTCAEEWIRGATPDGS
jgi:hypothetical protein